MSFTFSIFYTRVILLFYVPLPSLLLPALPNDAKETCVIKTKMFSYMYNKNDHVIVSLKTFKIIRPMFGYWIIGFPYLWRATKMLSRDLRRLESDPGENADDNERLFWSSWEHGCHVDIQNISDSIRVYTESRITSFRAKIHVSRKYVVS